HTQGDGDRGRLGDSRLPITRTANTWPPPATPTVVAAARHPSRASPKPANPSLDGRRFNALSTVINRFLTAESCLVDQPTGANVPTIRATTFLEAIGPLRLTARWISIDY